MKSISIDGSRLISTTETPNREFREPQGRLRASITLRQLIVTYLAYLRRLALRDSACLRSNGLHDTLRCVSRQAANLVLT